MRESVARYRARSARSFKDRIDKIKMDSGCVDCGYAKCVAALEFDHVRGEKLFTIGRAKQHVEVGPPGAAWQRILDEIAKCDIVCANCHRERHALHRREEIGFQIKTPISVGSGTTPLLYGHG